MRTRIPETSDRACGVTLSGVHIPHSFAVAITFQPGQYRGKTRISIFYSQNRCVLGDSQKYLVLAQGLRTAPGSQNQPRGRRGCSRGRLQEAVRNPGIFAGISAGTGCTSSTHFRTPLRHESGAVCVFDDPVSRIGRASTAPSHQSCRLKASAELPAVSLSVPRKGASERAEL